MAGRLPVWSLLLHASALPLLFAVLFAVLWPMPVLLLQALRVCWLLAIALFVWIVSAKVVVLASLDPGPCRSAKRTVGHRLAINHYLRRECRSQRGSFQGAPRRIRRLAIMYG